MIIDRRRQPHEVSDVDLWAAHAPWKLKREINSGVNSHAIGRRVSAQAELHIILLIAANGEDALYQWDYDGFKSAVGEDQEYYAIQELGRWHRAGPEVWKRR